MYIYTSKKMYIYDTYMYYLYPQFKNILITNLQNNLAYKYDEDKKIFITISKERLLEDIISERMYDINTFYEELKKILDVKKSEIIEKK